MGCIQCKINVLINISYLYHAPLTEALLGWQVALVVIGVLLWFLALGLDIVGVVLLILLAREKCKLPVV